MMSAMPVPSLYQGRWLLSAALVACAAPALAFEVGLRPGAEMMATRVEPLGSHAMPTGPWKNGTVPVQVREGSLAITAWRVPAEGLGTLELLIPLRAALEAEGWRIGFSCETRGCGGFDFRYALEVLPEPAMHVDLGDFRFLTATRDAEAISLLVSRASRSGTGHVQVIRSGKAPETPRAAIVASKSDPAPAPPALAARLEAGGAVLDGLSFASGKADLQDAPEGLLAELAAYLAAYPSRTIALVGHTDAAGSAEGNLALSRARAEAVRSRLVSAHGVDPARVQALGAGFMAPRASNLTEDGRAANRRVEAILTSTR